ncbi:MAG: flagellar motor protein MotB [Firmicutes bacterium]|jgi:chemotaxis protein MotB|nr:flagellar motor protein MotB [Bacillota bacterium]
MSGPHAGRARKDAGGDVEEEHEGGMERWLLTYSDMITLLLALFVVLYALSSLNKVKYAEFAKGLRTSFNNGNSQPSSARTVSSEKIGKNKTTQGAASLSKLEKQIQQALKKAGLIHDVQISIQARGLIVSLVTGKTFYSKDSAALSPVGERVVEVAGSVIAKHTNLVNVDGYTDNEPIIGGPYTSNWQLSAQRAVVVVQALQDNAHVNPTRLYAVGFGQYHPIVPNTSPANQAQNRRVEIVVSPPGKKVVLP